LRVSAVPSLDVAKGPGREPGAFAVPESGGRGCCATGGREERAGASLHGYGAMVTERLLAVVGPEEHLLLPHGE
jgi:hypothetical protein